MLLILFAIYSMFGIFTNYYIFVQSLNLSLILGLSQISTNYPSIFSYKSIQTNFIQNQEKITLLSRISAFLIMAVIIVWSFLVYVFKHFQVESAEMIDDQSVTASDFSIVIQNAPIQLFKDKSNIERQFGEYFQSVSSILEKEYFGVYLKKDQLSNTSTQQQLQKLKVTKINIGIPFYLNENNLEEDQ